MPRSKYKGNEFYKAGDYVLCKVLQWKKGHIARVFAVSQQTGNITVEIVESPIGSSRAPGLRQNLVPYELERIEYTPPLELANAEIILAEAAAPRKAAKRKRSGQSYPRFRKGGALPDKSFETLLCVQSKGSEAPTIQRVE